MRRFPVLFLCALALGITIVLTGAAGAEDNSVRVNIADGFDFPVGKPDAAGYYKSRGLRLRSPAHYGEDWNGRAGGNSDIGAPVYAVADGIVTFSANVRGAWGNVVLTRHAYRDSSGKVKYIDTLNGHLNVILVKLGQTVKRGQQIGTIGTNFGMYPAHLHFEMRHNITLGLSRGGIPNTLEHWADPTQFIEKHRKLKREWRPVAMPTGTYLPYKGHSGL